jgi:hypothetical protein
MKINPNVASESPFRIIAAAHMILSALSSRLTRLFVSGIK